MEKIKLGNFEELVLLLVGVLYESGAYSVSIVAEYEKQTGKKINISAIHTVLYRLEEKGFLESMNLHLASETNSFLMSLLKMKPEMQKRMQVV